MATEGTPRLYNPPTSVGAGGLLPKGTGLGFYLVPLRPNLLDREHVAEAFVFRTNSPLGSTRRESQLRSLSSRYRRTQFFPCIISSTAETHMMTSTLPGPGVRETYTLALLAVPRA